MVPTDPFSHIRSKVEGGRSYQSFLTCATNKQKKKAPLAVNGLGYSSVLMELFLSRWQIQQAGSRWEEMKSQVLLVMQTGCSQVAAHCW